MLTASSSGSVGRVSGSEWSRSGGAWDFLEVLCGLTGEAWLVISERLYSTAVTDAARRDLSALVRQNGVQPLVWSLSDGLETVAWHVSRQAYGAESSGRCAPSAQALEAACVAAVALLLRQQLGEKRFW